MADFANGIKKYENIDRLAPLSPRLVKIRDTCQFSKSLVDWYRNHQEDNTQILEEFPSCVNIKTHRRFPDFSQNRQRQKKKNQASRVKTGNKRDSGLSCFIGETEQHKKDIEDLSQENKHKSKQKSQNKKNAAVFTATKVLFTNNGDGVKFKFTHFADPEDVVSEYINVHIYNRTRLGRVDKKKVSASLIALHNTKKEASDFNDETNPDKYLHALRTSKNIIPSDQPSTDVVKFEKRLPKIKIVERAMATKNFIFELGALDALNGQNRRRDLEPALSVEPLLLSSKDHNRSKIRLAEDKKVPKFRGAPASVSLLPKLKPNELRSALNEGNADARNLIRGKTVLPHIPRRKTSSRRKQETCRKPSPDTNVKVADVKSSWQLLKQRRNCTQRMDCTKRLFDTLEKMSTEVYKANDPWSNPEANDYGEQILGIRHDENFEKTRDPLFSRKKTSEIRETETKFKKVPTKGTWGMGKIGNCKINTDTEILINETPSMSKKGEKRGLKSEVERYLDKYSLTLDKKMLSSNQKKEVSHPSPEIVADMLAKLNIFDVGFHIDTEKREESLNVDTSLKKSEGSELISVSEARNSPLSRETRIKTKAKSSDTPVNQSPQNNEDYEKLFTVEQTSGANQTDKGGMRKNNAFVEMGLKSLESQLSKDLYSQILKSDFLKRDLSFKPARFFRSSLNFSDTLNSGSRLILGGKNYRSDSSLCNKQLQTKIRCIIANCVGKSTKDGKKPLIIINKLKNTEKDFKKLHQIVDKRLDERKGKKKSFAQKFLEVQNDILLNPRLQAILPGLIDGIPNFVKRPTR